MQAKDIPEGPVLDFIRKAHPAWCGWSRHSPHNVMDAMPEGTPPKVALAKMASLIRRGLIDGCACGCRGDFRMPDTHST